MGSEFIEKTKDVDGFYVRLFYASILGKWNVDVEDRKVSDTDSYPFLIDEYFKDYHDAVKLYYNIEPRIFLALVQRG